MPIDLNNFAKGASNLGASLGGRAGSALQAGAGLVGSAVGAFNTVRSFFGPPSSRTVSPGATTQSGGTTANARYRGADERDWRVTLSIPSGSYQLSKVLGPIVRNGKFIFPFTPQITLSHQATYSAMDPVHNNYSFAAYENSKLDKISITGDFYCENSDDAAYWIASVHFLRSVTKMYFGADTENAGAPPPVLKLNGYGDFVFNNVPVVVTQFNLELPKDVDYIPSKFVGNQSVENADFDVDGVGYAPVKSVFTVTLMPVYSREAVRNFNLQDFVKGNYITDKGFI